MSLPWLCITLLLTLPFLSVLDKVRKGATPASPWAASGISHYWAGVWRSNGLLQAHHLDHNMQHSLSSSRQRGPHLNKNSSPQGAVIHTRIIS